MSNSDQIEKSLSDQILDKMIEKLNDSENFDEKILSDIRSTDLTNKVKVKEVISQILKDSDNENPKTGD